MMIIVQGYALKRPKEKIANEKIASRKERKKGERKDVDTTNSEERIPRTMIPASGTAPEPAGNPFIYGKFPQVPMLFLPEPTGKILGTWQQCSGRKNFVQEDA